MHKADLGVFVHQFDGPTTVPTVPATGFHRGRFGSEAIGDSSDATSSTGGILTPTPGPDLSSRGPDLRALDPLHATSIDAETTFVKSKKAQFAPGGSPLVGIAGAAKKVQRLNSTLSPLKATQIIGVIESVNNRAGDEWSETSSLRVDRDLVSCLKSLKSLESTGSPVFGCVDAVLENTTALAIANAKLATHNRLLLNESNDCFDEVQSLSKRARDCENRENWFKGNSSFEGAIVKQPISPYPRMPPAHEPTSFSRNAPASNVTLDALSASRGDVENLHGTVKKLHDEIMWLSDTNRRLKNAQEAYLAYPNCKFSANWFCYRVLPSLVFALLICAAMQLFALLDGYCLEMYKQSCMLRELNESGNVTAGGNNTRSNFWRSGAVPSGRELFNFTDSVSENSLEEDSFL